MPTFKPCPISRTILSNTYFTSPLSELLLSPLSTSPSADLRPDYDITSNKRQLCRQSQQPYLQKYEISITVFFSRHEFGAYLASQALIFDVLTPFEVTPPPATAQIASALFQSSPEQRRRVHQMKGTASQLYWLVCLCLTIVHHHSKSVRQGTN